MDARGVSRFFHSAWEVSQRPSPFSSVSSLQLCPLLSFGRSIREEGLKEFLLCFVPFLSFFVVLCSLFSVLLSSPLVFQNLYQIEFLLIKFSSATKLGCPRFWGHPFTYLPFFKGKAFFYDLLSAGTPCLAQLFLSGMTWFRIKVANAPTVMLEDRM